LAAGGRSVLEALGYFDWRILWFHAKLERMDEFALEGILVS
jgi:hypothetical protein